jgi:hypothetical protein
MALPDDVVTWIHSHFDNADVDAAFEVLGSAIDQTGQAAGPRLVRCAAVGSRGDLARLALLVAGLRIDFRDVITSGEYELCGDKLVQVHDFNNPIADA